MKICKQMWSCSITLACFCISSSEVQWWSWDLLFFFWIDLISLVFKYSDFFFLHLRIIYLCYSFICNPFFPWYHQSRISFSFHFSLKQLLLSVRIADHRDIEHRTSTEQKCKTQLKLWRIYFPIICIFLCFALWHPTPVPQNILWMNCTFFLWSRKEISWVTVPTKSISSFVLLKTSV